MIHRSNFFKNYGQFITKFPDTDVSDLFSKGQMESKSWLVDSLVEINQPLGTVFICAGWYGSLATFLFESGLSIDKIRSFDVDEQCAIRADTFNRSWVMDGWQFKASTLDIVKMTYPLTHTTYRADGSSLELTEMPDTIINTSCEHISNFSDWYNAIPSGKIVILQSNDYFEIDEHVNCSESLEEFNRMTPMQETYKLDKLELSKYTRYMKIGIK
jgi:hypothetical protein